MQPHPFIHEMRVSPQGQLCTALSSFLYQAQICPYDNIFALLFFRLEEMGFTKMVNEIDSKEAARLGLQTRPLTTAVIQKHLEDVGIEPEFGTHSRMRGLSGGQKVKVVLAAAMWNNPHILVLDEPTNYLDRESLGALAGAIRNYGGGCLMISHNRGKLPRKLSLEVYTVQATSFKDTVTFLCPKGVYSLAAILWLCVNPGTALFVLPLAGQGLLQGAWLASMAKFSASFVTQLLCSSHADSISLLHWTTTWYRLQLNSHIDTLLVLCCRVHRCLVSHSVGGGRWQADTQG